MPTSSVSFLLSLRVQAGTLAQTLPQQGSDGLQLAGCDKGTSRHDVRRRASGEE
jgi:hypothetical protein